MLPETVKNESPAWAAESLAGLTKDQLETLRGTVAKQSTDSELQLFLTTCKRLELDPFARQVHFIKYGTGSGTTVVGIDGFRSIAARTGQMAGVKRGVIRDQKTGDILYGWCEIYRKDWTHPAREEVPFNEYNTGKGMWFKMPETMIKKVAETAALRMAFPYVFSGVYGEEEMSRAAEEENKPTPKPKPAPKEREVQSDPVQSPVIFSDQILRIRDLVGRGKIEHVWLKGFIKEKTGRDNFGTLMNALAQLKKDDLDAIEFWVAEQEQVNQSALPNG